MLGNMPAEYQGKETSAGRENTHWKEREPQNIASVRFKMTLSDCLLLSTAGMKRIANWKNWANFFKFNSCVPSQYLTLHEQTFLRFVISACRFKDILEMASAIDLVWLVNLLRSDFLSLAKYNSHCLSYSPNFYISLRLCKFFRFYPM